MPEFCLIKQRVGAFIEDSPEDGDRKPDVMPVNGRVTFTPRMTAGDVVLVTDEHGVRAAPVVAITGLIVDGVLSHEGEPGIYLFAGGPDSNPEKIVYSVTYSGLSAGKFPVSLRNTSFEAIPGGEIDLSEIIPVAGTTGAGVTKGDKGDPFRYEDFTEEQLGDLKGDPFIYDDFTPEQLAGLKGEKGDTGDISLAHLNGTGSPEGRIAATVGTIYTDQAATNGAIRWIKTSGTGDTGWRVEYGDTGWRDVTVLFSDLIESGTLRFRRVGGVVHVEAAWLKFKVEGTTELYMPQGFIPGQATALPLYGSSGEPTPASIFRVAFTGRLSIYVLDNRFSGNDTGIMFAGDPWPTVLPGTPA